MRISHSTLAACALVALALPLAACGATDTAASEDGADDITIKADQGGTPIALPFKSGFGLSKHLLSRPFEVRGHTELSIVVEAKWVTPESCRLPTFSLTLLTATAEGPGRVIATRTIATDGKSHTERWPDLEKGEYAVELSSTNTVPACHLLGSVDILDH
jgi:hypothetical protein